MRFVVAALLALLALAPAAGAQGGATVARHGDVELLVRDDEDERGGLCVELRDGDEDSGGSCSTAPISRMSALLVGVSAGARSFVGGAIPADTFEVELEFARGERVRARTVTGESYTGSRAGKLAFFLAETTGARRPSTERDEDEPVLIRRFDASGTLIGAAAGGNEGARVAGPQTLGRFGSITVTASATREFVPSVIQLDRTEDSVCLAYRRTDGGGGSGTCAGTGPALPLLQVAPQRECGRGLLLHGFAAPQVATVELELGDGRRKRAATIDVSGLGSAARAVAMLVPPGQAIRSARALDSAGRVVDRQQLRAAPAPRRCGPGINGFMAISQGRPASSAGDEPGQVAAGAAPGPQLVARDEDDHLCLWIEGMDSRDRECLVPTAEGDFPQILDRVTRDHSTAAGLLPPGAESVRVVFEGGQRVAAEISDGGAYAGRYRGHVRFYLARGAGSRRVVAVETYDGAGKLVTAMPGSGATGRPRTFVRGRGYRLVASRYDFRFRYPGQRAVRARGTCFNVAVGGRAPDADDCAELKHGFLAGGVACSPRGGVVVGAMPRGSRGARFELAGGRTIASRTIRVPRRFGGGRLWVLEIPPRARVLRLRLLGRLPPGAFGPTAERVRRYPVPPPRRQCGYDFDVTF